MLLNISLPTGNAKHTPLLTILAICNQANLTQLHRFGRGTDNSQQSHQTDSDVLGYDDRSIGVSEQLCLDSLRL